MKPAIQREKPGHPLPKILDGPDRDLMRPETEILLEQVLAAVMAPDNDALTLATTLFNQLSDAPVVSVIRALLASDQMIRETFNGNAPNRADAALARAFALTLAEAADDMIAAEGATDQIRLGDLIS